MIVAGSARAPSAASRDSEAGARSWSGWQLLGGAALVVTLALTSPGVRLARAGDDEKPRPAVSAVTEPPLAGGTCSESRAVAATRTEAVSRAETQRIKQELARRAAETPSDAIVLDNRGHRY